MFKGTPERTAREIAEEVDAVGGDMNAYTTKEYTTFYVRALAEHVELGLDILCDILCRPALRPEEVDAERQVILEEVLMHRDEPADVVQELFAAAVFPGHPLGREVLGEPEVIGKVTVPEIRSFFDTHYLPGNMVIAAAGDLDHEPSRGRDRVPLRRAPRRAPPRSAGALAGRAVAARGRVARHRAGTARPRRARARTATRRTRFALAVLNHVLGGGLSSRLFQEIREDAGPRLLDRVGPQRLSRTPARSPSRSAPRPTRPMRCSSSCTTSSTASPHKGITARELEVSQRATCAPTCSCRSRTPARGCRGSARRCCCSTRCSPPRSCWRASPLSPPTRSHAVAEKVLTGPRTLAVVGPFSESDFT